MGPISRVGLEDARALRQEWTTVDAIVRELGSTLDLRTLADRAHRLLADRLGLGSTGLCLVDMASRRLELQGPRPAALDPLPGSWPLGEGLAARMRDASTPLVRLVHADLPDGARALDECLAFRLTDGDDVIGLVLLCDRAAAEALDANDVERLRSIGSLIGAALSRALVHQTLVNVTARLDTAQRLQQHILDHVSHEFNTPLMILKSAAEFADTDDRTERTAFLDMHAQALQRLEELVQGVLEVARARSHGRLQKIRAKEFRVAVIASCIEARAWPDERLHCWYDLSEELVVRVDPDGVGLVVDHLLRNAWQFGGNRGAPLAIAAYAARIERCRAQREGEEWLEGALRALSRGECPATMASDAHADRLVIDITDGGIGIPLDELEFVFEPFTQARNSPLRGVSGAGMGLPTCRKRVESMGGEIWLHSREGAGTRVTVLLPL